LLFEKEYFIPMSYAKVKKYDTKTKSARKALKAGPKHSKQQTNGCCGLNAALGLRHIAAGH
jgi:hypothetical protein